MAHSAERRIRSRADPATAPVLALLDRDGDAARVVGGAVRDALLGRRLGDIDIATTAVPDEVARTGAREDTALEVHMRHRAESEDA